MNSFSHRHGGETRCDNAGIEQGVNVGARLLMQTEREPSRLAAGENADWQRVAEDFHLPRFTHQMVMAIRMGQSILLSCCGCCGRGPVALRLHRSGLITHERDSMVPNGGRSRSPPPHVVGQERAGMSGAPPKKKHDPA